MTIKEVDMRFLSILFVMGLLVSCGDNATNATPLEDLSPEIKPLPEDLDPPGNNPIEKDLVIFEASRDYNPSAWHSDRQIANFEGEYIVPEEVFIAEGNAGNGWMTLVVGNTKYCYQGNARSSRHYGDSFKLKYAKEIDGGPCYSNQDTFEAVETTQITLDDELVLSVDGGGCSDQCEYTIVSIGLEKY